MDPYPDFPDQIRIFSQSGSGLRKKSPIRIRKKPESETLELLNVEHQLWKKKGSIDQEMLLVIYAYEYDSFS